jgi:CheY-like chemotaxis protein
VLVVDDEETVQRAMGRLLGKRYDVACADAAGALGRLERGERFDLVLCDVSMPGISGLELRRRVEVLDPGQARRLAFLTGATFGAEAEECLAVPGVALVDKAAGPDELRASVEARLRDVTVR